LSALASPVQQHPTMQQNALMICHTDLHRRECLDKEKYDNEFMISSIKYFYNLLKDAHLGLAQAS